MCRTLFKNNNYAILFDSIMGAFKKAVPKIEIRISNIVEIISDLKDHTSDEDNEESMELLMNVDDSKVSTTGVASKQTIATLNIKV